MRRGVKIIAWMMGVAIALIATLLIVIATLDWNSLKPTINARVTEAIGRPFAIQGDLGVRWSRRRSEEGWASIVPWPQLIAQNVSVANSPWASQQPDFAHFDAIRFRIAPLPLLVHRIEIPVIYLVQPTINLERNAQGQANWDFAFGASSPPSTWTLDLHAVGFDRGQISLRDATSKTDLQVTMEPLKRAIAYDQLVAQQTSEARETAGKTAGAAAREGLSKGSEHRKPPRETRDTYQFAWQATGTYQGVAAHGHGNMGAVLALQQADAPFPVRADMQLGDSHIAFVGTLTDPLHLAGLDVRLWFTGSNMAKLYPLTGLTLPDTPPYATEGHLSALLKRGGSHYTYDDFRGRVGGSDLTGNLAFDTGGERPKLSGAVQSQLLRFSDLGPLIGADTNATKMQGDNATPPPSDKVLPVEPFRTDRWRAMDADVTFSAARLLRDEALPINALSTHITMNDGLLHLAPLAFDIAGGKMNGDLRLDGAKSPMQGTFKLGVRHIKLKELFPTFEPMRTSLGEINGDASLDARGNSVNTLLGTSTGEVKLLMNDGAISKTLLETAGLNVGNIVIGKLFGDRTVKINCAAANLSGSQGLYQTRLFVLDTEDATIYINGTINFANEQLNLDVRPQSKGVRLLSLRSPLYVKGTMKNPDVGVQPGPLILRGGGAVALAVFAAPVAALLPLIATSKDEPSNACATVLQQMRGPSRAAPH